MTVHFSAINAISSAAAVTDPEERRALLVDVARAWNRTDVDLMVELSPDRGRHSRYRVPSRRVGTRRPSRLRAGRAFFGLEHGPNVERGGQLGVDPSLGLAGDEPEQR